MYDLIVACDRNYGIGYKGGLPWHCSDELKIFRKKTKGSVLLLGRRTYEQLEKLNLPNRTLVMVSSTSENCRTLTDAVNYSKKIYPNKKLFVAGGSGLFKEALMHPELIDNVHISFMKGTYECDTNMPSLDLNEWVIQEQENHEFFTHNVLKYELEGEKQYKDLLQDVLSLGTIRAGRNGETKSLFCRNMTFDLRKGFPLLTTKKMFFRGIVEELLFFIRGETNSKLLEEKSINIWKGNTDRKFLDSLKMESRQEGMMGPMYGYQWRFFGAKYDEKTGKPSEKGVDQLSGIVNLIRNDPNSRRIIMTDFNPAQADQGVLFPCHSIVLQFYVDNNYLDMFCYNRSQDMFLGTPFNIASSALLLTLISRITNLQPRYLHMSMGDIHIYKQHYEHAKEQITRMNYRFPTMRIDKQIHEIVDVENLTYEDIVLENYISHPAIKAEMVA